MANLTSRTWYLIGVGLMISAVTMAVVSFGSMINTVEGMNRVVVPGTLVETRYMVKFGPTDADWLFVPYNAAGLG